MHIANNIYNIKADHQVYGQLDAVFILKDRCDRFIIWVHDIHTININRPFTRS